MMAAATLTVLLVFIINFCSAKFHDLSRHQNLTHCFDDADCEWEKGECCKTFISGMEGHCVPCDQVGQEDTVSEQHCDEAKNIDKGVTHQSEE